MIFVVDANIIFSAILNTDSKIGDLIVNSSELFDFIAPDYLRQEIHGKQSKILEVSGYSLAQYNEIKYQVYKNLVFISEEQVSSESWQKAFDLVKDIDQKDTPYVAFSIHFRCKLWTGDKGLIKGLTRKGFDKYIITNELQSLKEKRTK